MSTCALLADEVTAAGFRLAGVDVHVPDEADLARRFERLCGEAQLVLDHRRAGRAPAAGAAAQVTSGHRGRWCWSSADARGRREPEALGAALRNNWGWRNEPRRARAAGCSGWWQNSGTRPAAGSSRRRSRPPGRSCARPIAKNGRTCTAGSLDERARIQARIQAVEAERVTRERRQQARSSAGILEQAWPLLQLGLQQRWQIAEGRRHWVNAACGRPLGALPAGAWTLRHAPGWTPAEQQAVSEELTRALGVEPQLRSDPARSRPV